MLLTPLNLRAFVRCHRDVVFNKESVAAHSLSPVNRATATTLFDAAVVVCALTGMVTSLVGRKVESPVCCLKGLVSTLLHEYAKVRPALACWRSSVFCAAWRFRKCNVLSAVLLFRLTKCWRASPTICIPGRRVPAQGDFVLIRHLRNSMACGRSRSITGNMFAAA